MCRSFFPLGVKPLALVAVEPEPLVVPPRRALLRFRFSEPVVLNRGGIEFKQFIEGNETIVVKTLVADAALLRPVEGRNEIVLDVAAVGLEPNAQYAVRVAGWTDE